MKITFGVVSGLLLGVVVLLLLNSLFLGLPVNPETYQYNYSNGTSALNPITNDSVNIHGSGVALSNTAYEVTYTESIRYANNSSRQPVDETSIYYQINNAEAVGYLQASGTTLNISSVESGDEVQVYENKTTAYVHTVATNNTTVQKTGNEPLVLTNQLRLPQTFLVSAPHITWRATDTRQVDGNEIIVYRATSANASQMPQITRTTRVSGTLQVNTHTNVITYSTTVHGTKVTEDGETIELVNQQALTYNKLNNTSVPQKPEWAVGTYNETETTTENDTETNTSDDGEWTPPARIAT